jgi:hypothetical protein
MADSNLLLILKNAVRPRMDTDGHGYQAYTKNQRFTRSVNKKRLPKSVFIRVHPWLMTALSDSNYGIEVEQSLVTPAPATA